MSRHCSTTLVGPSSHLIVQRRAAITRTPDITTLVTCSFYGPSSSEFELGSCCSLVPVIIVVVIGKSGGHFSTINKLLQIHVGYA